MADVAFPLRARILDLITSDSARQINFTMFGIRILGTVVGNLVVMGIHNFQATGRGGFNVVIDPSRLRGGGLYFAPTDEMVFHDVDVGVTPGGRRTIAHESLHAYFDCVGAWGELGLYPQGTPGIQDEAMAYVFGALFSIDYEWRVNKVPNYRPPGSPPPVFSESYRIADWLRTQPAGVSVPAADAQKMFDAVKADPDYRGLLPPDPTKPVGPTNPYPAYANFGWNW